jgi:hypothetical protein
VRRLAVCAAVATLAAFSAPAETARAGCGVATARAAIAATHLRVKLLAPGSVRVDPRSADQVLCFDFTRDGRVDVAVDDRERPAPRATSASPSSGAPRAGGRWRRRLAPRATIGSTGGRGMRGISGAIVLGVVIAAGCGGHGRAEIPAGMWTEAQAASIASVRGTPVRVRHCRGLGTAEKVGSETVYRRFACLAGARAAHETFDTVAVTYVLEPVGSFAGVSSRYVLTDVHFAALSVP